MAVNSIVNLSRSDDYLSLKNTRALRGIFAFFVLCHHIHQYCGIKIPLISYILHLLGYLSVAAFFFYSGYGLMSNSHKERYVFNLPRARIIPLYVVYAFFVLLYAIYDCFIGTEVSSEAVFQSFLFGRTIVPGGWYLQVTFVLYILFFLIFRFVPQRKELCFFLCLVLFAVACLGLEMPSTWYEDIFCFFLGMMWFRYKHQIDRMITKNRILALFISVVSLSVLLLTVRYGILIKILSSLVFVCTTNIFVSNGSFIFNNKVARFLGDYSLQIYLCQGFFLLLNIKSPIVFVVVTIVGTFTVSMLIKPICGIISKGTKAILKVD